MPPSVHVGSLAAIGGYLAMANATNAPDSPQGWGGPPRPGLPAAGSGAVPSCPGLSGAGKLESYPPQGLVTAAV